MFLITILKRVNIVVSMLISSIIVTCCVSTLLGKSSVPDPSLDEKDPKVWFLYYHDQFDGLTGKVTAENSSYRDSAHEAYQQAVFNRQKS